MCLFVGTNQSERGREQERGKGKRDYECLERERERERERESEREKERRQLRERDYTSLTSLSRSFLKKIFDGEDQNETHQTPLPLNFVLQKKS